MSALLRWTARSTLTTSGALALALLCVSLVAPIPETIKVDQQPVHPLSSLATESDDAYNTFQELYNRSYEPGTNQFSRRLKAFQESLKRHSHLNSFSYDGNGSARYGINQFSDLSPQEFKDKYLRSRSELCPKYGHLEDRSYNVDLPSRFDWRDKNVVTPVRSQQTCGGCWAFSVVEGIETAYAVKGNPLVKLSVQQVIDCSYRNQGCNGGSTISALYWLNQTHVKLVKESEYPFKAVTGTCHFPPSSFGVSIKGYVAYDFSDREDVMMEKLIEFGPLAVTVDALSWQDYLGGIIQHHCSSQEANHAVLITGFDRTGPVPYWIVRNSWGASWGNEGYVYVKIGENVCGIADTVSAAIV
ncbi:cathepsin O [Polypterus senegalus]|uniref:cathepsin O n=1 Tax=Polypterus senegalus TaxID=55291 RepID=UPI001966A0CC|nr:cathepsin O [Polypterus senegalus]